jgi:hypothetical protein
VREELNVSKRVQTSFLLFSSFRNRNSFLCYGKNLLFLLPASSLFYGDWPSVKRWRVFLR